MSSIKYDWIVIDERLEVKIHLLVVNQKAGEVMFALKQLRKLLLYKVVISMLLYTGAAWNKQY